MMKKLYSFLLLTIALVSLSYGQVVYQENFTFANGGLTDLGFTLINQDGLIANTGLDAVVANLDDTLTARPWTNFVALGTDELALSTSWYSAPGTSNDWLITPSITLTTGNFMTWKDITLDFDFPDGYEMRIATNAGTTIADFTTVLFTTAAADTAFTLRNVDLTPYNGQTVRFAFVNNSNDKFILGIDSIWVGSLASFDAAISSINTLEYSSIPLSQVGTYTPSMDVFNNGTGNITGVTADVTITDFANALVYTASMSTVPSITAGNTATLTDGGTGFTPTAADIYFAEYVVSITEVDGDVTNDTSLYILNVTDSLFSRDLAALFGNTEIVGAIGLGPTGSAEIGNVIDISSPTSLVSIQGLFNGALAVGDTVNARLRTYNGTTVGAQLATTQIIITPADTPVFFLEFIFNEPLAVGEYYVGIEETTSAQNMAIYYSAGIFTANKSSASVNGGAFADITNFATPVVPMVWANIYTPPVVNCSITSLAAGAQTPCNTGNNEYTQEVVVTFQNPPIAGMLNVNGQMFGIGASPQTVTLTGLNSDGLDVNVTASFTADAACTFTQNALFMAPANCLCPTINVAVNITDVNNCLTPDGSAAAMATGGTAPYTYAWTPNVGTGMTISGLSAGNYSVVVTDANGCTGNGAGTVANISGFSASVTNISPPTCFNGMNGIVTVTPAGGTAPFSYVWVGSASTNGVASGLSAGTYSVTVSDANSCSVNLTNIVVTEPTEVAFMGGSISNVSCFGLMDGEINDMFSGGTPPLMYTLDGGTAQSTGLFSGLVAGTYTVRATDVNGCFGETVHTITEPSEIVLSTSSTEETSSAAGDGTAAVSGAGGTAPYTYLWNDANAQTTATASGLNTGTFNVTVTDANGCSEMASVFVDIGSAIKEISLQDFTVYPNPATRNVVVTFEVQKNTDLSINFYNTIGNLLFSDNASVSNQYKKSFDISNLAPGIYFVEIQSEAGKAIKKLTVTK